MDADQWRAERTFTQRLVHALGHSLPSARMMSIIALGGRADPETAAALASCAHAHPTDVVQGMEVVRAIAAMPPAAAQRQAALRSLAGHHSRMVAEEARRILAADGQLPAPDSGAPRALGGKA
ncbi:hypothetical protein [Mycolicibacterium sp. CH28]|uniref:hypothetical protein n=1 Tax=Mycolicibacterium sp. CH28 TaxID=2512237 RepID=UPI0019149B21|nr:hypothetical protein [Mycolicibacterium sp. CH28]